MIKLTAEQLKRLEEYNKTHKYASQEGVEDVMNWSRGITQEQMEEIFKAGKEEEGFGHV